LIALGGGVGVDDRSVDRQIVERTAGGRRGTRDRTDRGRGGIVRRGDGQRAVRGQRGLQVVVRKLRIEVVQSGDVVSAGPTEDDVGVVAAAGGADRQRQTGER